MKDTYKKAFYIAACVFGVALASWATWRLLPSSADEMKRCAVVVSAASWHEVLVDGKPLLYFAESEGDSTVIDLKTVRDEALQRTYSAGFWANRWLMMPSCEGRIVTAIETPTDALRACADSTIMRLCREAAAARLKTLKHQKSELNYYMRVHSVHDYGYQDVAALDTRVSSECAETERVLHIIDSITAGKHGVCIKTRHEYTATYRTEEGKLVRTPLRFVGSADGLTLLQTADGKTPEGVATLALLPWNASDVGEARAVGFPTIAVKDMECDTISARILPARIAQGGKHNLPRMLAGNGTPVFSTKGIFVGIVSGDTVAARKTIRRILKFER